MWEDQARPVTRRVLSNRSLSAAREVLDLAAVTLVLVGLLDPSLLTPRAPPCEHRLFWVDPRIPVSSLFFRFGERPGRPVLDTREVERRETTCVCRHFTRDNCRGRRGTRPDGLLGQDGRETLITARQKGNVRSVPIPSLSSYRSDSRSRIPASSRRPHRVP